VEIVGIDHQRHLQAIECGCVHLLSSHFECLTAMQLLQPPYNRPMFACTSVTVTDVSASLSLFLIFVAVCNDIF